jgi:uncharacterized RDD family membrane protein YckC
VTDPQFEPTPTVPSGAGGTADLVTRFLARLIDHLLLGVVIALVIFPVVLAAIFSGSDLSYWSFGSSASLAGIVGSIVAAAITIGYFAFMESRNGQTVGKMLLGLRTEGPDGQSPTMEQAVRRNAWYALSIVPFLGGLAQLAVAIYIAITINNTGIGWHDTFAGGTRVVKTR